jgi:hypothetical protein
MNDHIPSLRQLHGPQILADALPPCGGTSNENRDIRAQRQPQLGKCIDGQPAAPHVIQAEQYRGSIRASATQTAPHGNPLPHAKGRTRA